MRTETNQTLFPTYYYILCWDQTESIWEIEFSQKGIWKNVGTSQSLRKTLKKPPGRKKTKEWQLVAFYCCMARNFPPRSGYVYGYGYGYGFTVDRSDFWNTIVEEISHSQTQLSKHGVAFGAKGSEVGAVSVSKWVADMIWLPPSFHLPYLHSFQILMGKQQSNTVGYFDFALLKANFDF